MAARERLDPVPHVRAQHGRTRAVIEAVLPSLDGGRFPVKRVVGDVMRVEADVLVDGHDVLAASLLHRMSAASPWEQTPMVPAGNDRFAASFALTEVGRAQYTVEAWVDAFATFRHGLRKKVEAGQDVELDLRAGIALVDAAAARAKGDDARTLRAIEGKLSDKTSVIGDRVATLLDDALAQAMARNPDRSLAARHGTVLDVVVDPPLARCSAWYELFPRSCGEAGEHGTFADAEKRLPYVAELGFDVVYLPPIHPIGRAHRKGPNNTLIAGENDPGSPWAIGCKLDDPAPYGVDGGGHKSVHPELGTLKDFDRFVARANELGLQVALDIAFQASPDHPYVSAHPEWFVHRADGSIQYAENPPKKYQDVYPFAFDGEAWSPLWEELKSVFLFWLSHGVTIFRVDNPHTKPLPFWEWCLAEVKAIEPRALFLAEAFTRPKLMQGLAKRGFSQSYTYFTWRNTREELGAYLLELTTGEVAEYLRPCFWPNTPDILPEHLQHGGRAAFLSRLVLAATMSSNYGIYGPAFELMEHVAREGSEEYVDNEKFELKRWDLEREDSLRHVIRRVNELRRDNPALQSMRGARVHATDNEFLFAYSKAEPDAADGALGNVVLCVVLLDHHHAHEGWIDLDLAALGVSETESYQVHELLGDARYHWRGKRAFVRIDPQVMPAQIFRLRRVARTETSFEYYL